MRPAAGVSSNTRCPVAGTELSRPSGKPASRPAPVRSAAGGHWRPTDQGRHGQAGSQARAWDCPAGGAERAFAKPRDLAAEPRFEGRSGPWENNARRPRIVGEIARQFLRGISNSPGAGALVHDSPAGRDQHQPAQPAAAGGSRILPRSIRRAKIPARSNPSRSSRSNRSM